MSHHHTTDLLTKELHPDWRFIVAVVLMLIAILTYVFTLDDSFIPGAAPAAKDAPPPGALGQP